MKNQILIGESGGSKTDWVLVREGEIVWQFSVTSFHPNNWNASLFKDLHQDLIDKNVDFRQTDLHFFGAGCNRKEKADELKNHFNGFGFHEIIVSGDLLAAGRAALGAGTGYVAILGSGSVLIDFQKGHVVKHFGGLGREKGDEGAGYYFGRLVCEAYSNKELEAIQASIMKSVLSKTEQNALDRGVFSSELCLDLASRLGNNLFEFQNFHLQNCHLFYSKYVQPNVNNGETLFFVGSYAYFHQEIIKSYFTAKGYSIGAFVSRPIEALIDFYRVKSTSKE